MGELSFMQRFIFSFCSPARRAEMQAESERWRWTCPDCGAERSVWAAGGIRYRAYSRGKFNYMKCGVCGRRSWMPLEKQSEATAG